MLPDEGGGPRRRRRRRRRRSRIAPGPIAAAPIEAPSTAARPAPLSRTGSAYLVIPAVAGALSAIVEMVGVAVGNGTEVVGVADGLPEEVSIGLVQGYRSAWSPACRWGWA